MAVNVNENGSIKDLGVRSNLDWNGIEYIGQQWCCDSSIDPVPVFDLPRPLSDYKYMILFGHMNNGNEYTELCAGILVFSPVDVYNNYKNSIVVGFMHGTSGTRYITITDLAALKLYTFKEGRVNSYQRLYGIY